MMPKRVQSADTSKYPTQREKVDALTQKMEAGIREFMQSEKYLTFLRTMSKFHNYSFRNCLLIAMQNPNATLVAGYQAWQQKFDRQVERGAKGMRILAPVPYEVTTSKQKLDAHKQPVLDSTGKPMMESVKEKRLSFRAVTVFDVSQTTGKPLPQLGMELDGSVENYELLLQAIHDASDAPITIEPIDGTAKGYYDRSDHTIHVKAGMSEAQTVKTALHELTHSVLHHADAENAAVKSRQAKECEAESVAFIVCEHFGLDTSDYSFPYLASWSSADLPEIHASLATIQQTADALITKISAQFQELQASSSNTIFGNIPCREITDKAYIRVSKEDLPALLASMERQNIAYSGKRNDKTGGATLTIDKADQAKVKAMQTGKPQSGINIQSRIVGNASYHEIPDKSYLKIEAAITDAVMKQLDTLHIPYIGKLDPMRGNIITVSRVHKKLVEELVEKAKCVLSSQASMRRR